MKLPILFQDDIGKLSKNREEAQLANERVETMTECELFDLHQDKSICVVLGANKARRKLTMELEANPLILCGKNMRLLDSARYLGDELSINLSQSVFKTIKNGGLELLHSQSMKFVL